MSSINELKKMSEKERALWLLNANAKDLGILLKNYGVKGISNINKKEKMSMILDLVVENITDEEIDKVMEDTKKLQKELNVRLTCGDYFIKYTLYARYKNKEISYNQMRKVCDKYNLDIPLSDDEENSINFIDKHYDMFSWYLNYDSEGNIYYSVLSRDYEWENLSFDSYDYRDDDWFIQQFFEKNTVDNGDLQLAYTIDNEDHYVLCVYKDYELLGTYVEGDMHRIKELVDYDYKLSYEDLDTYEELLCLLNEQQEEFWRILDADKMLQKKLKMTEKYNRQVIIDALNRSKCLNSNVHLNNN